MGGARRASAQPPRLACPIRAEAALATIAAAHKTTITRQNPILECELPLDGSRFEGLIPPVVSAPVFAIRRKASAIFSLADYAAAGIMTEGQKTIIEWAAANRENILIVGGTGSGKTTLVNAVIAHVSTAFPEDRLVILEDTAEIQCASAERGSACAVARRPTCAACSGRLCGFVPIASLWVK